MSAEKKKTPAAKKKAVVKKPAAKKPAKKPASKTKPPEKKTHLVVEQYASAIRRPQTQRRTLRALGLGRIGKRRAVADCPEMRGQIRKVAHMVRIVEGDAK